MKKIRWGILGYGNIAKRFIKSLAASKTGELYAIASLSQHESLQSQFPDLKIYNNYQSLLEDAQVDVVYIALVHGLHKLYSIEALKAKKAVFTEKPATLNARDLKEVLAVAEANQVFYGEALKTRYNEALLQLAQDIKDGLLGTISFISASFEDNMGALAPNHYMFDLNQGGALWDLGSYPIGFVNLFIKEKPSHISATMFMKEGIDTSTHALLTYGEHLQAHISVSTTQTQSRYALIRGEKGIVYMNHSNRPTKYDVVIQSGSMSYSYPFEVDDMYTEIEAVHQAINNQDLESRQYPHHEILRTIEVMDEIRHQARRVENE